MTKHYHIHLGPKKTRDSDDDGGRWITIEGAHVHIGAHGKIDKGPAALMEKSEHQAHGHQHRLAGQAHGQAKKDKGENHPDAPHHHEAAMAHYEAARNFDVAHHHTESGDLKQAKSAHAKATASADKAKAHEAKIGTGAAADKPAKEKPASHQKLHDAAEKAVKGSEKHEAEHKRLAGMYDKATADWERSAINRRMERNHVEALDHHADTSFAQAKTASDHAKSTGGIDHHETALKAIGDAREKVEKSSSIATPRQSRLDDLKMMQQHHQGKIDAHKKLAEEHKAKTEAMKSAQKSPQEKIGATPADQGFSAAEQDAQGAGKPIPPGGKKPALGFKSLEDAKAALGEAAAMQLQAKGAFGQAAPAPAKKEAPPAKKQMGSLKSEAAQGGAPSPSQLIAQEAHNDAASTHRAKATTWANPAYGKPEEGSKELAAMHTEAAEHHEHMAANPHEDHSERGKHLGELKKRIAQGESWVQMGQGHKLTGKPKPGAATPGKAPGKPAKASGGSAGVDSATQAVKGLKDAIKKAGDASDPDPKKQA